MNKQQYHKPELRLYGNISAMTQSTAMMGVADGNTGTKTKTS